MSRPPLRPRATYGHWTPIATRWSDNDLYGHVNNTVYYTWFGIAVTTALIELALLDVAAGDPIGVVVESGCRYAAPLAFPDPVEIGLRVASIGNSSVIYHLGVFAAGAEHAAAEGHFIHAYVDRANRRSTPLPPAWRDILAGLNR